MHDTEKQDHSFTPDSLIAKVIEMVLEQYKRADSPEFDIMPAAFVVDSKGVLNIVMISAPDYKPALEMVLEKLDATMYCFACPSFFTQVDPKTQQVTGKGEGVIFTLETPTHSEMWYGHVTRNPLPVLAQPEKGDQAGGRLSHLLHQHTRN